MTEPQTEREWCRRTGLYPEAVRRYRISAYWVQKALGEPEYQGRVDDFVRNLARDLGLDREGVLEQARLLLSYPIMPVKEAV